jgi:hypothetical protein
VKRLVYRLKLSSGILLGAAFVVALLVYRLGDIMSGISVRELATHQQSASLHEIAHHAVYWHYHLLMWLLDFVPGHQTWVFRLTSVVYATVAIGALVYILRRWYGPRTALFGFTILICSAMFLHVGRLATPDVAFFAAIPLLLVSNLFLYDDPERKLTFYLWVAVQLLVLAVPGMVWFVLLNIVHHRSDLRQALGNLKGWLPISALVTLIVMLSIPLASGLILGHAKYEGLSLVGAPQALPTITQLGKQASETFLTVSIRGTLPDDVWLNHLPMLDVLLTVMLILGAYFYSRHLRAPRTVLIAEYSLLAFVLISIGGPVSFSLIAPVVYLVVAGGLAYLLHLWLKVFPRNPLARSFGISLLIVAVVFSCAYGLRQYFVAWPHHPEAVQAFQTHELPQSKL